MGKGKSGFKESKGLFQGPSLLSLDQDQSGKLVSSEISHPDTVSADYANMDKHKH